MTSFDDYLAEGEAVPVEGWNFDWFEGRATEERPPWGYAVMLSDRIGTAESWLDLQTGGGEVAAWAADRASARPTRMIGTESWAPNAQIAARRGPVARAADRGPLPFRRETFDLISARHPVVTPWSEVSRLLATGGTFFSQQIGPATNRELTEFFMGPRPIREGREPSRVAADAAATGMEVVDIREKDLRVEFYDLAAVIVFLRKVIWTVPHFSVDSYRDRLRAMHRLIERDGRFVSTSRRFLIEARRAPSR